MGRGSHFLWRRPCGKEGKIGIDLAGVGVDDDGVLPPGELQCQSALAAGGRSGNKRHSRAVIGAVILAGREIGTVHVRCDHSGKRCLTSGGYFGGARRSEEHTSELQSLMRSSYAVFCLKKKIKNIV